MSHTPGPWKWEGDGFADEPPRCPHSSEWVDHGPDLAGQDVAVITSSGYDASSLTIKSADARLIAAAPELLHAAKVTEIRVDEVLHELGVPNDQYPAPVANAVDNLGRLLVVVRAAIAKATGEQS